MVLSDTDRNNLYCCCQMRFIIEFLKCRTGLRLLFCHTLAEQTQVENVACDIILVTRMAQITTFISLNITWARLNREVWGNWLKK